MKYHSCVQRCDEREALRRFILRADFERGRRVLLNAIADGDVPQDSVWAANDDLKEQWRKSFLAKWKSQEQSKRQQYIHIKQPNHIVPDIRKWSEIESVKYNKSFGGIDCVLGVDLELNQWSNDRLTGWDGNINPSRL
jgi:hypothetical protein